MERYFLNGHRGKAYFELPEGWKVATHAIVCSEKKKESISSLVADAITHPLGTPPLEELIKGKEKIVIIVDDPARPTPKRALLVPLVESLHKWGVRDGQITVLIGIGTHRPVADAEIGRLYRKGLPGEIRFVNHDCHAPDLVPVGTLKHGGILKINRLAAEADLRIAVGSILPHPFAGFGGGAKAVLPGIAGYETVRDHHLALMIEKGVFAGSREKNPFHDEILGAGRLARLDFIINVVYDCDDEVKGVVAGHFEEAHRAGVDSCVKELGVSFEEPADVTLISAFPYRETQVLKPMCISDMVTREGGVVILYADRIEDGGFAAPLLAAFDAAFARAVGDRRRLIVDLTRRGEPIIPGIAMDFNAALNMTLLFTTRMRTLLVSQEADKAQAVRIGLDHADSLQGAIDSVARKMPQAKVNVIPSGGVVLPILSHPIEYKW